jgi:all-trans-8'-apo-beta-carotenal 15,15'-oxygenase
MENIGRTEQRIEEDPLAARRAMGRGFHSLPREHGLEPLVVEGAIPRELSGTLYRNGPALFDAQGTPYRHWLDGDGAISAVRIANGRAEGAVRVTLTRELTEERSKGRMLYSSGFTQGPVWRKRLMGNGKNSTNVHVLAWQGRVFAMPEMGVPYEIDPTTLATKGPSKFDGVLRQLVNAHVRTHPTSGNTYAFGPSIGMKNALDVYVLPRAGSPRLLVSIPMKRPVMVMHDLAMSDGHLIFLQHPIEITSMLPMMMGMGSPMEAIAWNEKLGSEVIVVPLAQPAEVVRFEVAPFFRFHYGNAFEESGSIAVDLCRYGGFSLGDTFMLDALRSGEAWKRAPVATYERLHLDLKKRDARFERIWDANADFVITHPKKQGLRPRFIWALVCRDHVDGIEKLDLTTGEVRRSTFPLAECPGEPTFVPRPGATDEDDGWILTMVYDGATDTSYVAVLDARDPAHTLAKLRFDHHVPFPIHGTWVGA